MVPNSKVLQFGDGLHSINNMTYVSIESVNTRQPRLKVNSPSKRVDAIFNQKDLTSIEVSLQNWAQFICKVTPHKIHDSISCDSYTLNKFVDSFKSNNL